MDVVGGWLRWSGCEYRLGIGEYITISNIILGQLYAGVWNIVSERIPRDLRAFTRTQLHNTAL